MTNTIYKAIANLTNNDGLTLKKGNIVRYKTGWQVADYGVEAGTAEEATKAVEKFGGSCGVWLENGIYYIDHSFRVKTKKEALTIGKRHNQISVYGWQRGNLAYC